MPKYLIHKSCLKRINPVMFTVSCFLLCLKNIFLTILGNLILYDYELVHQIDLLGEHFQLYT